jgi:positive regulator of sigma E activity
MREKGTVVGYTPRGASVRIEPSDVCKNCPACHFCRPAGGSRIVETENNIGAHIDDEVYIDIASKTSLLAFFLLFGLPVLLGLSGVVFGSPYGDTYALLCGATGIGLGLVIAKIINNKANKRNKFLPRIVEIIHPHKA